MTRSQKLETDNQEIYELNIYVQYMSGRGNRYEIIKFFKIIFLFFSRIPPLSRIPPRSVLLVSDSFLKYMYLYIYQYMYLYIYLYMYLNTGLGTPFFSVLFHAVRYILFRSKKRTLHSFPFFSRVFGDL